MSGPSAAALAKVPERLSEAGWTNGLFPECVGEKFSEVPIDTQETPKGSGLLCLLQYPCLWRNSAPPLGN